MPNPLPNEITVSNFWGSLQKSDPIRGFLFISQKNLIILKYTKLRTGEIIMSKIIFNEYQIRQIEANQFVASVSDRSIQYTPEFKVYAVKENLAGKGPVKQLMIPFDCIS